MDILLENNRTGPTYLRIPGIAQIVLSAIREGGERDYLLHDWVIMPNHVHLLITPHSDVPTILRRLKGATAREANKILNRTGMPFWQQESYDHLVRSDEEFRRIQDYILQNPVRAGLEGSVEEYTWSSASRN